MTGGDVVSADRGTSIPSMVDPARTQVLNSLPVDSAGRYVLYWMQQSQRAEENSALGMRRSKPMHSRSRWSLGSG